MNRLKFLLFAIAALGLWGYHLVFSPAASLKVAEQGAGVVAAAAPTVALRLEAQRSDAQAAIMRVASAPAAWNVGPKPPAKAEPPGTDRFNSVRELVVAGLSDADRSAVVIAISNELGALVAQGSAEPATAPEGFDLPSVSVAGAAGVVASFGGATFIFFSTPLLNSDKNEVRTAGSVVVGVPMLPDAKQLELVAREFHLTTLAVLSEGKTVVAAGADKSQADLAAKSLKVGQVGALVSGSVRQVGPLAFPLFVENAPHSMGARQAISGTPFEVLAVVSTRESLEALAAFQLFGVGGLAGLLLLSVVVLLLIKSGEDDEGGGMAVPPPMPLPPAKKELRKEPDAIAHEPHHHGPEASPDDFHFPAPPASTASNFAISTPSMATGHSPPVETGQAPALSVGMTGGAPAFTPNGPTVANYAAPPVPDEDPFEPAADPFAVAAPASKSSSARPPSKPPIASEESGERTVAYPVYKPPPSGGADPFAVTASQSTSPIADDNPDATRVAAVPAELIKAARSASGTTGERPAVGKLATMPKVQSVAPVAADAEERHFHDVFREFVATREKCGEPADGLTYEKFKGKLLKNKEALVSKYQCRTVRFQVYVKEGKAALKATPVKD